VSDFAPRHFDGPQPSRDPALTWTILIGGRRATLRIGMRYLAMGAEHQGRPCELIEVDDSSSPRNAYVRFVDPRGGDAVMPVIELELLQLGV
jgi:hypothetical protein